MRSLFQYISNAAAILVFFLGFSFETKAQEFITKEVTTEWVEMNASAFIGQGNISQYYKGMSNQVCNIDTLGNLLCFEPAWRNGCIEIYAFFGLAEDNPYFFPDDRLPILRIDNRNEHKLDWLTRSKSFDRHIIYKKIDSDYIMWRVQVGTWEEILTEWGGIFFQLQKGDFVELTIPLEDGPTLQTKTPLRGIKPFLNDFLTKIRKTKPREAVRSNK